jgi:hypothetical protein
MRSCLDRICFTGLLLSVTFSLVPRAVAQFGPSKTPGFGNIFSTKQVVLHRRLPPVINVNGKSITVNVTQLRNDPIGTELQVAVENLLTQTGSGVRVATAGADILIDCQISLISEPRVERVTQGNQTTEFINGALSAVFRISQPGTGTLIASGVSSAQFDSRLASNPGQRPASSGFMGGKKMVSTTDAHNALVSDAARQIASYLVQTDEAVPVSLAVATTLTPADKLAESNLWTRNLEELETLAPFPDPKLDSYRTYNFGVANEALAYQAQDAKAAVKYLQEASIDYGKALADKPDEKYFLEPQNRIKTALAHYTTPSEPPPPPQKPAELGLSNEDVIALVNAKLDDANIIETIQSAPKVNFDLSVNGLVSLTRAGVKGPVLTAMRNKAKGTAPAPAPAPSPKTSPATKTGAKPGSGGQ